MFKSAVAFTGITQGKMLSQQFSWELLLSPYKKQC